MDFQAPHFTGWNITFTALGAAFFWFKSSRSDLKAYMMSDLVAVFVTDKKKRYVVEFLLFVTIGTFIGVAAVQPINVTQAITGGIAWTSSFTFFGANKRRGRT
jgi:hypothetical protein